MKAIARWRDLEDMNKLTTLVPQEEDDVMRKKNPSRSPSLRLAFAGSEVDDYPDIPLIHFASGDQPPPRRTIRGQRRRPGSDRPSSGRAEAPRRDERPSSSGGGLPPVSGG